MCCNNFEVGSIDWLRNKWIISQTSLPLIEWIQINYPQYKNTVVVPEIETSEIWMFLSRKLKRPMWPFCLLILYQWLSSF